MGILPMSRRAIPSTPLGTGLALPSRAGRVQGAPITEEQHLGPAFTGGTPMLLTPYGVTTNNQSSIVNPDVRRDCFIQLARAFCDSIRLASPPAARNPEGGTSRMIVS